MWFVYILRCADASLYIGETNDVERHLTRHNQGFAAAHTAKRRPVRLVYTKQHPTRVGRRYCIDAMLEHAVMHPIRHTFQLEELMEKR